MRGFLKSVAVGTALGGGLPAALFCIIGIFVGLTEGVTRHGIWSVLYLSGVAIAVAFGVVLSACLFIGLPVTWSLRRLDAESLKAYSIAGGVAGALIPFVPLAFSGGPWSGVLLALGCLSGIATARIWWFTGRARASHAPAIDEQASGFTRPIQRPVSSKALETRPEK